MKENSRSGVYRNKLMVISFHHGVCFTCGRKFKMDDEYAWQFAHIEGVKAAYDKGDRWSGRWRFITPFSDEWLDWVSRIRLTCSHRCNNKAEGSNAVPDEYTELPDPEQICFGLYKQADWVEEISK